MKDTRHMSYKISGKITSQETNSRSDIFRFLHSPKLFAENAISAVEISYIFSKKEGKITDTLIVRFCPCIGSKMRLPLKSS